jgi:uncharacterized protein (DUF433 family)
LIQECFGCDGKSPDFDEAGRQAFTARRVLFEQPDKAAERALRIRGMRVTVGMIVGQIGAGAGIEELLDDYPYLGREDIMQAPQYAAALAQWREVALADEA